jgi:hypothetical protein
MSDPNAFSGSTKSGATSVAKTLFVCEQSDCFRIAYSEKKIKKINRRFVSCENYKVSNLLGILLYFVLGFLNLKGHELHNSKLCS